MKRQRRIESLDELSERFARELQELVDGGEISTSFAERIKLDLFEPAGEAGHPNSLRWAVWRKYAEECLDEDLSAII